MSAPAPRPWIARATISCVIDVAVPPTIAPAMNTTIPMAKNGLRPWMSDSRP